MNPIDLVLHLDEHLNRWAGQLGPWLYVVLFAIVFAETGLVILPFLPGDSLLFALGALTATEGSPVGFVLSGVVLSVAAILGDAVNYSIGRALGPKVFTSTTSRLLNREHLARAHAFYEKYGGKTIVIARFVPIVRTFAPFVAGVGTMSYPRFATYNVLGGLLWVWSVMGLGWLFGDIPWVQDNFWVAIVAVLVISVLPLAVEWFRVRRAAPAPPAETGRPASGGTAE